MQNEHTKGATEVFKNKVVSIDDNQNIINQETIFINEHQMKDVYMILSKNDFGVNLRVNAGIFNKKSKIIISNENSLLLYNRKKDEIILGKIEDIINDSNDENEIPENFIIYKTPISFFEDNDECIYSMKFNNENIEINKDLAIKFASYVYNSQDKTNDFFNYLIKIEDNKISFNKILINFNTEFLVYFIKTLEELITEKERFFNIKNINIYSMTNILNTLGCSYSVRKINDDEFNIRYKFPLSLLKYLDNQDINDSKLIKKFRTFGYFFVDNKLKLLRSYKEIQSLQENINEDENLIPNKFKKAVNNHELILMPTSDFVFIKEEPSKGYDVVTEGNDGATNFILPGLPLMKNSDGDILGVIAIHTKEAALEAEKEFGIFNKRNTLSQLNGEPLNWIANDAILGLYEFTK